jgi:hypothetical protein
MLFSPEMIRALLAGIKTETRRVVTNVPPPPKADCHPKNTQKHEALYLDAYCSERRTQADASSRGGKRQLIIDPDQEMDFRARRACPKRNRRI